MRAIILILFLIAIALLVAINSDAQDYNQVYLALNKHRVQAGLKPLEYRSDKQRLCDQWAEHLSEVLIHNSTDNYFGEAIGEFLISTETIIPLFLESEAHRRILMNKKIKAVCIGIYYVPESTIITGSTVEFIPETYYTVIRTY